MTRLAETFELAGAPVESLVELDETTMWSRHGVTIWQADRFSGSPNFYPVYRYQDYYSYSPLSLIRLKGNLRVNPRAAAQIDDAKFLYYSGSDTIDQDIVRVGGPPVPRYGIVDSDTYARKLAKAMCEDIERVEVAHPGYTNVILCGGKDSLNLTLLPWTNPVIVASAPPNYDLVKAFMADNHVSYDLIRLDDNDDSLPETEILVNCCRNNLQHCRWAPQLKRLTESHNGKVIFWKGQLGDIITTGYWKHFSYKQRALTRPLTKRGSGPIRSCLERCNITQRLAFNYLWTVGAMWQGAHNGIERELFDALVLSGYHGPAVQDVWTRIDFKRACQDDIRPLVGRYLLGDVVVYPEKNPGPPPSEIRKGISDVQTFVNAIQRLRLPVFDI